MGPATDSELPPAGPERKLLAAFVAPATTPGELPGVTVLTASGDARTLLAAFLVPATPPGAMPEVSILAAICGQHF